MSKHSVSIITPLFNSELYISDAIDSVLSQSYSDFEMIIIDDHSTDQSVKIVKKYNDPRIKLICLNENRGTGIARNKGLELAVGRYIAFLDADDIWLPNKLEKQIEFMKSKNVVFCFSSFHLMDSNGMQLGKYRKALKRVNYDMMLKNNYIGCLTAIYDTKAFGKIYMSDFRKRQDWGYWLKLLSLSNWAESLSEPLASYRIGNKSLSKVKWNLIKSNYLFYKEQVGLSPFQSINRLIAFVYYYFHYRIKYTKKEIKILS